MYRVCSLALALALQFDAGSASAQGTAPPPDVRIVLLGTGGPELTPNRFGIATLIEAGGHKLLFDTGRGVLQRIYESGVRPTEITRVFLTHLHNDHIEGLPTLWLTPWFLLGREAPLAVWGPPGTRRMVAGMRSMFSFDIEHRVNAFNKVGGIAVDVVEIGDGPVLQLDGIVISAFPVWHDDGNPAFGYRIAYKNRVVVLSGDTTYSERVVAAGHDADVIVHNVIAVSERLSKAPEMRPILGKLTTPEQAAQVFLQTKPRLAVLSHIVKKELHGAAGDAIVEQRIRAAGYRGPIQIGLDRMVISVGATIDIAQPTSVDELPDADSKASYAVPR